MKLSRVIILAFAGMSLSHLSAVGTPSPLPEGQRWIEAGEKCPGGWLTGSTYKKYFKQGGSKTYYVCDTTPPKCCPPKTDADGEKSAQKHQIRQVRTGMMICEPKDRFTSVCRRLTEQELSQMKLQRKMHELNEVMFSPLTEWPS